MGHQLLIENEDAVAMASELASLTGETVEAAVTAALRQRLDAERSRQDHAQRVARVLAIAAEIRSGFADPVPTSNHDDLYDENGLPC